MVDNDRLQDMFLLTALIYEYGESFFAKSGVTLADYVAQYKVPSELSNVTQHAFNRLVHDSSDGVVEKFINHPVSDVQVAITRCDKAQRLTIVFRGSESLRDWCYNCMAFRKTLGAGVKVHSGFYRQLHQYNVFETLSTTLHALFEKYPSYDVYATGHSLGGALATLFSYEFSSKYLKKIIVVTFGSPRVGNSRFVSDFEQNQYLTHARVCTTHDIFPNAPFWYGPVGVLYSVARGNVTRTRPRDIPWWRHSLLFSHSIQSHLLENYYLDILGSESGVLV